MIDTLHLFLCIADLLINLPIMDLRTQDGREKGRVEKLDWTKQTHLAAYEHFLNDCCKISFCWYAKDSKLNWRDLYWRKTDGMSIKSKSRIFSTPQKNEIQHLWSTFIHLINSLKRPDCDADDLESGFKQYIPDKTCDTLRACTCYECTRIYLHIWKHL